MCQVRVGRIRVSGRIAGSQNQTVPPYTHVFQYLHGSCAFYKERCFFVELQVKRVKLVKSVYCK